MYKNTFLVIVLFSIFGMACNKEVEDCCFFDDDDMTEVPDTTDTVIPCWEAPIMVELDTTLNQMFTRSGPGWTGADGTLSIPLPDGRTFWIFGDTFLGTVKEDRSRTQFTFVNNTVLLQEGDQLINPVVGARSFATPPESGWWYWPGHGQVVGDTLELIMYAMYNPGGGMWGFEYAAIDLLKYTLPDLALVQTERKKLNPHINFGTSILESNGYTYIYGAEKQDLNKYFHVARCPSGTLSQEWEYFDGEEWTPDESKSRRQAPNVSEQYTVFEHNGKFYLLTQHHVLGSEIYLYQSNEPHRGFNQRQLIYCTPETGSDIITYNAFAHYHMSQGGSLLISYNVNSLNFQDVLDNADNYRPYFFNVSGWE